MLYNVEDVKKLPRVYGDILHSKISEDLRERPILAFDDQNIGLTVIASLQCEQGSGRKEGSSNPTPTVLRHRISYLNEQVYYIIMGDRSEFEYHVTKGDESIPPLVELEQLVFHHMMRYKGEMPAASDIAEALRQSIEDKIENRFDIPRPRFCEAFLAVRPFPRQRAVRDSGNCASLYRIVHDRTGDNVIANEMLAAKDGVSYYSSNPQIWEDYKTKHAILRAAKQNTQKTSRPALKDARLSKEARPQDIKIPRFLRNIDDALLCSLIATVAALTINKQDTDFNPAMIDLVTVPFVPPPQQKARDRYGPEYLVPLYETAKLLAIE